MDLLPILFLILYVPGLHSLAYMIRGQWMHARQSMWEWTKPVNLFSLPVVVPLLSMVTIQLLTENAEDRGTILAMAFDETRNDPKMASLVRGFAQSFGHEIE